MCVCGCECVRVLRLCGVGLLAGLHYLQPMSRRKHGIDKNQRPGWQQHLVLAIIGGVAADVVRRVHLLVKQVGGGGERGKNSAEKKLTFALSKDPKG